MIFLPVSQSSGRNPKCRSLRKIISVSAAASSSLSFLSAAEVFLLALAEGDGVFLPRATKMLLERPPPPMPPDAVVLPLESAAAAAAALTAAAWRWERSRLNFLLAAERSSPPESPESYWQSF